MFRLTAAICFATGLAAAQPVEIVLATYGSGQLHDVTGVVRSALAAGKQELPVTLDALGVGDPAPGRVKTLRIIYRAAGLLFETAARDFETIALPVSAPSAAAPSVPPASAPPAGNGIATGGFFDPPATAGSGAPGSGVATAPPSAPPSAPPAASTIVSPVASVPNGACFYMQSNYGGTPYCFASGSASADLGSERRRFRSMRLVGAAQAAVLFDANNFSGASARLTQSQPDLRTARGAYYTSDFDERAASLRVE